MNCFDKDKWDGDTPKKEDDPYAPNEWGLAGGQGHTTKELEESVKALGFVCLCFIIGIAGVLIYMAVVQFMGK